MVTIINYGLGNLGSILNMLKKIEVEATISSDPGTIGKAEKLILPGVGAFDNGMRLLEDLGLYDILNHCVLTRKVPILGICLGMQLMTKQSEEGVLAGLSWIDATTKRFRFDSESGLKVPHMGWNTVQICGQIDFFEGISQEPRFYFVHSYHAVCENENDVLTKTSHGYEFVSAFKRNNVTGVQFHPEKSHKFGMAFLKNWVTHS
ncbi:MAG: Imidazole glycerol phosphate synthase subunit HisH 1 [Syntrophorhabdus sp. PtaU1.Bin153]|nr:MAG: Imidazole glycerol phosphate synthase subunit HisH 1 [Syntrophorhabdus sp. PtaU1.Bin153]